MEASGSQFSQVYLTSQNKDSATHHIINFLTEHLSDCATGRSGTTVAARPWPRCRLPSYAVPASTGGLQAGNTNISEFSCQPKPQPTQ